jgi:hypothetical protein
MGVMNWKRPTAIKGTLNHAKTSFSTEICAGARVSIVQHLVPLPCPEISVQRVARLVPKMRCSTFDACVEFQSIPRHSM